MIITTHFIVGSNLQIWGTEIRTLELPSRTGRKPTASTGKRIRWIRRDVDILVVLEKLFPVMEIPKGRDDVKR